jgi:SAM-dependent methyltransferase
MSHLGGAYPGGDTHTFTPDVWGYLLIEHDIRSVIDIGCGYGWNAQWFLNQGCEVWGIEGDPEAINGITTLPPERVIVHDYTTGPYVPEGKVDLILATEFVEHVEQKYEANWIATAKQGKWLLMCHAVPGQGGHHHVNEQTTEYWVERLRQDGFEYFPYTSAKFRATCERKPAPWGRNTLCFFENVND